MHRSRDLVVAAGGALEPGTLDRCVLDGRHPGRTVVDLRHLRWIQPYGLVSVAVFIEAQLALGRKARVLTPLNSSVAAYVARMGLGEVVTGMGGTHDLPTIRRHTAEGRLLELQRFTSSSAAEQIAAMVYEKLVASDEPRAAAIHQSICELSQNVIQHSGRASGFAAAQTTHNDSRVAFAIGDSGVGLLESLSAHSFANDRDVLAAVMRGGVSRTGDVARGNGIRAARELLTARSGFLHAHSGNALRTEFAADVSERTHAAVFLRGTILQGTIDY